MQDHKTDESITLGPDALKELKAGLMHISEEASMIDKTIPDCNLLCKEDVWDRFLFQDVFAEEIKLTSEDCINLLEGASAVVKPQPIGERTTEAPNEAHSASAPHQELKTIRSAADEIYTIAELLKLCEGTTEIPTGLLGLAGRSICARIDEGIYEPLDSLAND